MPKQKIPRNTNSLLKNLPYMDAYKVRAIYKGSFRGIKSTKREMEAAKGELIRRGLKLRL